ncbi:MAG: TRAM domain-containing protein, partial [Bacteroidota bacterium]
ERPGTFAAENYEDDVPEDVKTRRLTEIIDLQNRLSYESKKKDLGKEFDVLVEGVSKRSAKHLYGRNKANKVIVFPKDNYQTGDIARVKIADFTSATLIGELL